MSEEKKELFVGIDLHKRRWHVPVRSETVKPLTSSAIWAEKSSRSHRQSLAIAILLISDRILQWMGFKGIF